MKLLARLKPTVLRARDLMSMTITTRPWTLIKNKKETWFSLTLNTFRQISKVKHIV
jgi:hypothetical protein